MQLEDQTAQVAEREPVAETGQGQEQARETPSEQRQEAEQATESGERAEGAAAEEQGQRAEDRQESEREQAPMPAWMQRRMNEMTAARREAERRAQAAEERLARFNQGPGAQEQGQGGEGDGQRQAEQQVREQHPELTQEQIRAEAARMVAADRFNETCNSTFDKGKEQFPDFEKTVGQFQQLGGLKPEFLQDVIEAGNAHMVLHHLGRDLDEADRVMSLPPRARVVALARLSDKLAAPPPPKPISKAPAPIDPVGGAGRPSALNTDPDSLSTAEWMRRRNAGEIR